MFTPEERLVYHCPHTKRAYDPLVVKRALVAAGYKADKTPDALIPIARRAFSLPPVGPDGSGVLDAVVWETLCAFTRYLSGKGSRVPSTQPVSPCTESRTAAPTTTGSP